jgi:hypothetical protein
MAPRNPEVAVLLLHAGANPFLCDGKGKTARQTTSHPTESVAIALHCGELAYTGSERERERERESERAREREPF